MCVLVNMKHKVHSFIFSCCFILVRVTQEHGVGCGITAWVRSQLVVGRAAHAHSHLGAFTVASQHIGLFWGE